MHISPTSWLARWTSRLSLLLVASLPWMARAAVDVDQVTPSLVRVFAQDVKHELIATGTGYVVSDRGDILTNQHVIKGARFIQVGLAGDNERLWQAQVLEQSSALDFALLQAPQMQPSHPATLSGFPLKQSQRVYALGFPGASDNLVAHLSMEPTYTEGIISKVERANSAAGSRLIIQHTAALAPGNSGGPLLNQCNQVIGTNTLIAMMYDNGPVAPGFYGAIALPDIIQRLQQRKLQLQLATAPCDAQATTASPSAAAPPRDKLAATPSAAMRISWPLILAVAALLAALLGLGIWGWLRTRPSRSVTHSGPLSIPTPVPQSAATATLNPAALASSQPSEPLMQRPRDQDEAPTRRTNARPVARLQATALSGAESLLVLDAADFANGADAVVLGRDPAVAHLQLADPSVSRRHLRFRRLEQGFSVEDMNSANGSRVNDVQIQPFQPYMLRSGDLIRIGDIRLRFLIES